MRITCVAVLIVVANASAQVPVNANEPYWPGATWETTTPERSGLDAGKLEATAVFVLAQDSTSFLVIRGGRIVVEKYGDGGGVKVKRRIASATKSMTAILVGMALDAGKFKDLDQPVVDFLPAWKETGKAKITLRHLLSMTSGLGPRKFMRQRPTGDQFLHNGKMPLVAAPGEKWQYNTPAYHMIFRLLEKATGKSLADWTTEKLLGPLGMKHSSWNSQVRGDVTNYFNLECSARDMGRFGLFVMRGGKWRDEQLVSEKFFKAATTSSQKSNPAYGHLFWLNAEKGHSAGGRKIAYRFPGAPRDTVACLGARGQQIIAIPSQDLVLVRQGDSPNDPRFAPRYVRMVLAAIQGGGFAAEPIPENKKVPASRKGLPRAFARLDVDGDGKLSAKEFGQSEVATRQPGLFEKLDTDGDGFLTKDEAARLTRRRRR